jgi:hypothetical protein
MLRLSCVAAAMAALGAALPAQSAGFQPFGSGCAFGGQTSAIGNQGLPVLGTSFTVTYAGANVIQPNPRPGLLDVWPQLALGLAPLTTPLPQSLLPQQPAGCTGLIQPVGVVPTVRDLSSIPPRNYVPGVTVAVPNNSALLGVQVLAQWLVLVRDSSSLGLEAVLVSDAATLTLGT